MFPSSACQKYLRLEMWSSPEEEVPIKDSQGSLESDPAFTSFVKPMGVCQILFFCLKVHIYILQVHSASSLPWSEKFPLFQENAWPIPDPESLWFVFRPFKLVFLEDRQPVQVQSRPPPHACGSSAQHWLPFSSCRRPKNIMNSKKKFNLCCSVRVLLKWAHFFFSVWVCSHRDNGDC